jgi:hypothetical protein
MKVGRKCMFMSRCNCPYTFMIKHSNFRILRVLAMVYDTLNYWVSRLCPSSRILHNYKILVFSSIQNSGWWTMSRNPTEMLTLQQLKVEWTLCIFYNMSVLKQKIRFLYPYINSKSPQWTCSSLINHSAAQIHCNSIYFISAISVCLYFQ